eukprot:2113779-Rhodomonas_salina.3
MFGTEFANGATRPSKATTTTLRALGLKGYDYTANVLCPRCQPASRRSEVGAPIRPPRNQCIKASLAVQTVPRLCGLAVDLAAHAMPSTAPGYPNATTQCLCCPNPGPDLFYVALLHCAKNHNLRRFSARTVPSFVLSFSFFFSFLSRVTSGVVAPASGGSTSSRLWTSSAPAPHVRASCSSTYAFGLISPDMGVLFLRMLADMGLNHRTRAASKRWRKWRRWSGLWIRRSIRTSSSSFQYHSPRVLRRRYAMSGSDIETMLLPGP